MAALSVSLKDDHNCGFLRAGTTRCNPWGEDYQQKAAQRVQGAELEPTARSRAAVTELIAQFHFLLFSRAQVNVQEVKKLLLGFSRKCVSILCYGLQYPPQFETKHPDRFISPQGLELEDKQAFEGWWKCQLTGWTGKMGFQENILQRSTFNSSSGLCSVLAGPHSLHVRSHHARKFSCTLPHNVLRPSEANIHYPSVIPWNRKAFPFSWIQFTFTTQMIVRDRRDMNHRNLHVRYQLIWSCPLSINVTFSLQCFLIFFFNQSEDEASGNHL